MSVVIDASVGAEVMLGSARGRALARLLPLERVLERAFGVGGNELSRSART
jgi:hypothetical protein